MQQVSKVLVEQNRKVKLLEIKLLVSSEILFFFVLTELLHVYFGEIKCCVCDIVLLCAK